MTSQRELDDFAAAMSEAHDPGWSADYYLLRYRIQTVLPRIRGRRVLELGCAEGGMTRALASAFPEVVAVDGSRELIERAQRTAELASVRFECCLLEQFVPAGAFDAIVAACVLEHVEDAVGVLRRARDWLAPGGHLHIVVPNARALNRRIGHAMGMLRTLDELHERDILQGHRRVYSREALLSDIEGAGLQLTHLEGSFLKPLSDKQMEAWSPELLDAFFSVGRGFPDLCAELYAECRSA